MIKLLDLLNEDEFQSEEPSSFSNEQEVIQDYINDLTPEGITMSDVMEDVINYPHAFQLRLLMELAKRGLLKLSTGLKVPPKDVPQLMDSQFDIAMGALANYNLNEAFFIGEDDIDEYDVENEQDIKEFVEFMREYQQQLNEADCDCLLEAKYQGRTVPLGKPMRGDSKKFKVYVKNPKTGKVVKVNFGAKGMNIKKNNPVRRKAFRARHNCANPGPRTKARYWSCRKW